MKILLAYDGSKCADAALDDLSRAGLPEDTQLTVLTVAENWLPLPVNPELLDGIEAPREFRLLTQRAATRLRGANPGWEIKEDVLIGSPATLIIEKSKSWNPDLRAPSGHCVYLMAYMAGWMIE
jgi:nucleotide-binding universal stress UspA family protein